MRDVICRPPLSLGSAAYGRKARGTTNLTLLLRDALRNGWQCGVIVAGDEQGKEAVHFGKAS